jgi:acyl carrier protein
MDTDGIFLALKKMQISTEGLTEDSFLAADLGMDSLEIVDFELILERQMGISLPSEILEDDISIGELRSLIHDQMHALPS